MNRARGFLFVNFVVFVSFVSSPGAMHEPKDFQLPPKSVFDASMPRYPNAWFYVDVDLAASYEGAIALITGALHPAMQLREFTGELSNPEGSDLDARLEHLQPWEAAEHRALQHADRKSVV